MSKGGITSLNLIYLLVVIYALCYQLQAPLEPFLVDKLVKGQGSEMEYAKLQSFFSVVQVAGSFMVGFLIDYRVGLRGMFVLNFVGCAGCYCILAGATTLSHLYASKLPSVLMTGFLCAQAAVAKCTAEGPERAGQSSNFLRRQTRRHTLIQQPD